MKKILLSATAIVAFTTAAVAADLPSRRAPPVYVPPAPVFTWTGFYGGFNVGAGFSSYTDYTLVGPTGAFTGGVPFHDTNASGVAGGGQIGYNFQIDGGLFGSTVGALGSPFSPIFGSYGGVIAGVEADVDGTSLRKTDNVLNGVTGLTTTYSSRTDFVGTVRGRLGYAFGNLLLFGTGGFAYGGVNDRLTVLNGTAGGAGTIIGINRIQTGYAYGGGVEYAIPTASFLNFFRSSAVTVKAEFIHYDLGATIAGASNVGAGARIHNDGDIARVGINYKFGAPAAPVVARY